MKFSKQSFLYYFNFDSVIAKTNYHTENILNIFLSVKKHFYFYLYRYKNNKNKNICILKLFNYRQIFTNQKIMVGANTFELFYAYSL